MSDSPRLSDEAHRLRKRLIAAGLSPREARRIAAGDGAKNICAAFARADAGIADEVAARLAARAKAREQDKVAEAVRKAHARRGPFYG